MSGIWPGIIQVFYLLVTVSGTETGTAILQGFFSIGFYNKVGFNWVGGFGGGFGEWGGFG